jgi:hypothetical protein
MPRSAQIVNLIDYLRMTRHPVPVLVRLGRADHAAMRPPQRPDAITRRRAGPHGVLAGVQDRQSRPGTQPR